MMHKPMQQRQAPAAMQAVRTAFANLRVMVEDYNYGRYEKAVGKWKMRIMEEMMKAHVKDRVERLVYLDDYLGKRLGNNSYFEMATGTFRDYQNIGPTANKFMRGLVDEVYKSLKLEVPCPAEPGDRQKYSYLSDTKRNPTQLHAAFALLFEQLVELSAERRKAGHDEIIENFYRMHSSLWDYIKGREQMSAQERREYTEMAVCLMCESNMRFFIRRSGNPRLEQRYGHLVRQEG